MTPFPFEFCAGWICPVIMVLIFLTFVGLMVYFCFFRRSGPMCCQNRQGPQANARPTAETPGEILRRRFASGEISKEEFASMRTELKER